MYHSVRLRDAHGVDVHGDIVALAVQVPVQGEDCESNNVRMPAALVPGIFAA